MTFPATTPSIEEAKAAFGLVELSSFGQPGLEVRHIIAAQSVKDFFDNPPADFVPLQYSFIHETFVLNRLVVASLQGKSNKTIAFERMRDVDEVWVMCVRKPKHEQWRFFGRFVAPGLFVMLMQKSRIECGTKEQYAACIEEFQAKWLEVFGGDACMREDSLEAYFGAMVVDYDAE